MVLVIGLDGLCTCSLMAKPDDRMEVLATHGIACFVLGRSGMNIVRRLMGGYMRGMGNKENCESMFATDRRCLM